MKREVVLALVASMRATLAALEVALDVAEGPVPGAQCPQCGEASNLERSDTMGEGPRVSCLECGKTWEISPEVAAELEAEGVTSG